MSQNGLGVSEEWRNLKYPLDSRRREAIYIARSEIFPFHYPNIVLTNIQSAAVAYHSGFTGVCGRILCQGQASLRKLWLLET